MTVHSAVQRTASGGIPTRQGVVILLLLLLLLVEGLLLLVLLLMASDASAVQTRLAPHIDILREFLSPDVTNSGRKVSLCSRIRLEASAINPPT